MIVCIVLSLFRGLYNNVSEWQVLHVLVPLYTRAQFSKHGLLNKLVKRSTHEVFYIFITKYRYFY